MSESVPALPRPLPFWRGARAVFDIALEGMVWTRRSLLMALLLLFPVGFALLYRFLLFARIPSRAFSPFDAYAFVAALYYVRNALPLVALFYAVALVADEVEGKTITYFFTRPVTRASILLGKFMAYMATTLSLSIPALVVTFFLLVTTPGFSGLGARAPSLLRDMGVVTIVLAVYGALFTLMGVALRRPVIPGLLFLFAWELLALLPGYLPRFTITAYVRSLMPYRPPSQDLSELFGQVLPLGLSLGTLGGMLAVFLGLSLWIFSRREYVLEQ